MQSIIQIQNISSNWDIVLLAKLEQKIATNTESVV